MCLYTLGNSSASRVFSNTRLDDDDLTSVEVLPTIPRSDTWLREEEAVAKTVATSEVSAPVSREIYLYINQTAGMLSGADVAGDPEGVRVTLPVPDPGRRSSLGAATTMATDMIAVMTRTVNGTGHTGPGPRR